MIEDKNENKVFHPSLDIKDNILVIGFRIKNEDGKESDIFMIKTSESLFIQKENLNFIHKEQSYMIDKKKRLLIKLSQKLGAKKLDELIQEFNEPTHKRQSGLELYEKIKKLLRTYVELENEYDYSILTAWIIGTYFFPTFSTYPYIHIKAPKGSGKSQCLNFILQTAFNAVKARASLPALRDTVDALRGTYLIDQADILQRQNMENFLDILTDSYKRGGGSMRKMMPSTKNAWVLEEFEAYSPKCFASIHELPEDLRDRCIVIPLVKTDRNYSPVDDEESFWKEIRGELYTILLGEFIFITQVYELKKAEYKVSNEILGRHLELWLPIEAMMTGTSISEEEIEASKERFLSRYEFSTYQTSEIETAVIEAIITLLKEEAEIILRPKEIAEKISSDAFDNGDKSTSLSSKQKSALVGRAINKFNLASKKVGRDHRGERYLFSKAHLEKTRSGYSAQAEPEKDTHTYTKGKDAEYNAEISES